MDILTYIQDKNVIHRDITPDNLIKRKQDNKLVLIDFGAVKQLIINSEGTMRRTKTIVIGKEDYMPDEQANGRPGFYSDVYAVGVIAIQACIGCIPSRDYDSGEIIWRHQALNISPELANILDKMTRCYFKERYQLAIDVLKDLKTLSYDCISPGDIQSKYFRYEYARKWYLRANNLKNNKYHKQSLLLYKKALEINPQYLRAIFNIGIVLSYLKLYDSAIDAYKNLLTIKPFYIDALLQKGINLYKLSRYNEALSDFDLVIQHRPNQPVAWFYKSLTLKQLNQLDEALKSYQEAIRLRPNYANQFLIKK